MKFKEKPIRYFIFGILCYVIVSFFGYLLINYGTLRYSKKDFIAQAKDDLLECAKVLESLTFKDRFLFCDGTPVNGSRVVKGDKLSLQLSNGISYMFFKGDFVLATQTPLQDLVIYAYSTKSFFVYKSPKDGSRPWNFFGRP